MSITERHCKIIGNLRRRKHVLASFGTIIFYQWPSTRGSTC